MKLITMTDFVLEQVQNAKYDYFDKVNETFVNKVINYANFLKQPLELWMFVPCDEDGNVLQEPIFKNTLNSDKHHGLLEKYQQAKERCLFDGFIVQNNKDWIEFYGGVRVYIYSEYLSKIASVVFRELEPMNKTIEDLVKYNLQLKQTAIKQLGL